MTRADALTNPYIELEAFAPIFRQTKYALKRSGYLRKNKDTAEADWNAVAKKLGPEFFKHIVASGIAITLVSDPPQRLLADMMWACENPPSNKCGTTHHQWRLPCAQQLSSR